MNEIAIDFETYLISNEEPFPKPVCLSYYRANGDKGIVTGSDGMDAFLTDILSDPEAVIIAHNMSFEANVIWRWFPHLSDFLHQKLEKSSCICTKVYDQLINCVREKPIHTFSLADLVQKYFDTDISEDKKDPDSWRLRYSELDGVPLEEWPEKAVQYALDDSIWAYKIYQTQKIVHVDHTLSVSADCYLNYMGARGFQINKPRVAELEEELLGILNPKYKALEKYGITIFEDGKWKKKMNNLREFIDKHIENKLYTAKGIISTSSESLTQYLSDDINLESISRDIINDFLTVMKYEKMITAFINRLKEADPVIRSTYNPVVSSGRTSSRASQNFPSVNIQQMPREVPDVKWDIRNCFEARSGYKIVAIDYAGLELASTAYMLSKLTHKQNMLNTINSTDVPVDMHSKLAARIMSIKERKNVTYENFMANKKKKEYAEYRQLSKPINLGFPGGIGYDTMRSLLAKQGIYPKFEILNKSPIEWPLLQQLAYFRHKGYPVRIKRYKIDEYALVYDELVELKQEMFNLYPDLEYFLHHGHELALTGESKPMKNEFGEWENEPMYQFEVGDFKRDWCTYTKYCNGLLMQSPSAIGAKRAMNAIIRKYFDNERIHPLAFIHDEIVFEVLDNDEKYAIIEDISQIMIDQMQTVLPKVRITVEAEICGDYWRKAGGEYSKVYWKDGVKNGRRF